MLEIISSGISSAEKGVADAASLFDYTCTIVDIEGLFIDSGDQVGMDDLSNMRLHEPYLVAYTGRVWRIVNGSDCIIILGNKQRLTEPVICCRLLKKPYIVNPDPDLLLAFITGRNPSVIGVIGDTTDRDSNTYKLVFSMFRTLFTNTQNEG